MYDNYNECQNQDDCDLYILGEGECLGFISVYDGFDPIDCDYE